AARGPEPAEILGQAVGNSQLARRDAGTEILEILGARTLPVGLVQLLQVALRVGNACGHQREQGREQWCSDRHIASYAVVGITVCISSPRRDPPASRGFSCRRNPATRN